MSLTTWRKWLQKPLVRRTAKGLRFALLIAVLSYLFLRLSVIGWKEISRSLPDNPLFYMIFAIIYLALPISDLLSYQKILKLNLWRSFPVMLRKRVYNYAVFSYSGEAYFGLWLKRHLKLTERQAFSAVKDNNLLSGLVSNLLTVILLAIFLLTGQLNSMMNKAPGNFTYVMAGLFATVILIPVVIKFRRHLIALPGDVTLYVIAAHTIRNLAVLGLLTLQWSVALPDVALGAWALFLTAMMVLTRLPFLPNQDLVVLGLALSIAGFVDAPTAAVAGMFVAAEALNQGTHLAVLALTSFGTHAPRQLATSSEAA